MNTTQLARPARVAGARASGGWMVRHPLVAYFALAYGLSWLVWIPAGLLGGGQAMLVLGAFGPAAAALVVLRATGGSIRDWARQLLRWRVGARYYVYALGLPALLLAAANVALAAFGREVDLSLLGQRLPSYVTLFVFVTLRAAARRSPGGGASLCHVCNGG